MTKALLRRPNWDYAFIPNGIKYISSIRKWRSCDEVASRAFDFTIKLGTNLDQLDACVIDEYRKIIDENIKEGLDLTFRFPALAEFGWCQHTLVLDLISAIVG